MGVAPSSVGGSEYAASNSQNKPKTIQNGHYHASSSRSINEQRHSNIDLRRTPSIGHSVTFAGQPVHASHQSLRGQPYDRYLTSQLQLQVNTDRPSSRNSRANGSGSRLSMASGKEPRGSTDRVNANSQAVLNQEDTFGIFASDEDPKLYQRR